jgi:two-component sensor histidine kinase
MVVADEGPGLPASAHRPKPSSIGQTLVRALVKQLRATLTITSEGGTVVRVEAPIDDESPPRRA